MSITVARSCPRCGQSADRTARRQLCRALAWPALDLHDLPIRSRLELAIMVRKSLRAVLRSKLRPSEPGRQPSSHAVLERLEEVLRASTPSAELGDHDSVDLCGLWPTLAPWRARGACRRYRWPSPEHADDFCGQHAWRKPTSRAPDRRTTDRRRLCRN